MKLIRLPMLKPLHAGWVVEFYNEMSSVKGKKLSKVGEEKLEFQIKFALGANHPSIRFMILKGRSGTCVWKQMTKARNTRCFFYKKLVYKKPTSRASKF